MAFVKVFNEQAKPPYFYRKLIISDAEAICDMATQQNFSDMEFFDPHHFDLHSVRMQFNVRNFFMMGVFDDDKLIGYFFMRFSIHKKCVLGRLIDKGYRGEGIGEIMNSIMYNTAWGMDFRCFSTISKNNKAVIRAHKKNQNVIVLKEKTEGFIELEFIRKTQN